MPSTLVIHAHPSPRQSVVVRSLLLQLKAVPHTTVRSLYTLYPDFDIDVAAEQAALAEAELVVWLAPVYWYSVPALLKHWFDRVLANGWAYGTGGAALRGKTAWWIASAGGSRADYTAGGVHQRPFADFIAPIEQTARFCGMHWLVPHIEHGGHNSASFDPAQPTLAERLAALHQVSLAPVAQPGNAT
jgi:glutathione-regulated potassium-efflux system ancillary protein KefF